MARLLLVVERTWVLSEFERRLHRLKDRPHLLLAPGIVVEPGEWFRPGDRLLLKRPDGSILDGRIGGFAEIGYNRTRHGDWVQYDSALAVVDLGPDDVPMGTEIWSVDRLSSDRGEWDVGVSPSFPRAPAEPTGA
jgi:hypothetical protein